MEVVSKISDQHINVSGQLGDYHNFDTYHTISISKKKLINCLGCFVDYSTKNFHKLEIRNLVLYQQNYNILAFIMEILQINYQIANLSVKFKKKSNSCSYLFLKKIIILRV